MKNIRYVVAFSALVIALAFTAPLLGGAGFAVWAAAPLLVALLLRAMSRDWSGLGIKPKVFIWYLISLAAFPAVMALTVLIATATSSASLTGFSAGAYLRTALTALPIFLAFAFVEEFGWRGYLAPKLASLGINSYLGHALVGVVWATWHLPYLSRLSWIDAPFIPLFFLACIAFSIVYGEVRLITGTFWPAVLMHGAGNAFGHPLEADYLVVASGKDYLASVGTGLITIALFTVLGVVLRRRRTVHR